MSHSTNLREQTKLDRYQATFGLSAALLALAAGFTFCVDRADLERGDHSLTKSY